MCLLPSHEQLETKRVACGPKQQVCGHRHRGILLPSAPDVETKTPLTQRDRRGNVGPLTSTSQPRSMVSPARGQSYQSLGLTGATAQLADGRLFVSGLQVHTMTAQAGLWQDVVLDEDGAWQSSGVALLDFEDGIAPAATQEARKPAPWSPVAVTSFDGSLNVGRLRTQPPEQRHPTAPLNTPGCSGLGKQGTNSCGWTGRLPRWPSRGLWAQGSHPHRRPLEHPRGSGQCASPAKTTAPEAPCGRPNRDGRTDGI